jgi:hypothetical protein
MKGNPTSGETAVADDREIDSCPKGHSAADVVGAEVDSAQRPGGPPGRSQPHGPRVDGRLVADELDHRRANRCPLRRRGAIEHRAPEPRGPGGNETCVTRLTSRRASSGLFKRDARDAAPVHEQHDTRAHSPVLRDPLPSECAAFQVTSDPPVTPPTLSEGDHGSHSDPIWKPDYWVTGTNR